MKVELCPTLNGQRLILTVRTAADCRDPSRRARVGPNQELCCAGELIHPGRVHRVEMSSLGRGASLMWMMGRGSLHVEILDAA